VSSKPLSDGGKQRKIIPSLHRFQQLTFYTSSALDPYIAIRTFGSTVLLGVKVAGSSKSSPSVQLTDLTNIVSLDVGNKPIIDVKLLPGTLEAAIVNDHGAVYRCSLANGQKQL
jgi:hypothetical protein